MTKTCIECGQEKPLEAFHRDKSKSDGFRNNCKECRKRYYVKHADKQRHYAKRYYRENPDWVQDVNARRRRGMYNWRKKHPEKAKALQKKQSEARRFKKHGITKAIYEQMLVEQKHLCKACQEPFSEFDQPVIDHCHASGRVRGVIHANCNVALGMIRDNPTKARNLANYLEQASTNYRSVSSCADSSPLDLEHIDDNLSVH